ncbi:hypothetical protein AAVH_40302 [Aphelenchoides avenae]|nr:hypothetical protein AAVH_40302 [Aphelenchus avenae]
MASKRDITEAVRQINAEEPTYLNLTIACGLNKVSELTRKAKELRSQSEVLNAIKECEKSIEDQIKKCDSTVTAKCFVTSGSANTTSDLAAGPSTSNTALPSTSSATPSNAGRQNRAGMKRKLPEESDSSDDEGTQDFYETLARIRRICDMDIVNLH